MSSIIKKSVLALAVISLLAPSSYAQNNKTGSILGDIIDILLDSDTDQHRYLDAGAQVHVKIPKEILDSACDDWYYWSVADYGKAKVVYSSKGDATIKGLKSTSSTIINYQYNVKVFKDGKDKKEERSYPITLTIRRVTPTGMTINQVSEVGWGTTASLLPTFYPECAEAGLSFESSDPNIVSVFSDGRAVGNTLGEADVHIKSDNGLEASTHVVVVVPKVSVINITGYDSRMKVHPGDNLQLGFQYGPEHAVPSVSWMSTDSGIATVDQLGQVSIVGVGTAKIICKDKDGVEGTIKIKSRK